MKYALIFLLPIIFIGAGKNERSNSNIVYPEIHASEMDENLLSSMTEDNLRGFTWINEPDAFSIYNGVLKISPGDTTDYFNDALT